MNYKKIAYIRLRRLEATDALLNRLRFEVYSNSARRAVDKIIVLIDDYFNHFDEDNKTFYDDEVKIEQLAHLSLTELQNRLDKKILIQKLLKVDLENGEEKED